jgi:ribosomal-protein-alanine N-acetyltransferase
MGKVELRYQKVSDANEFYRILTNPNFTYFLSKPKSLQEEIKFLKKNPWRRKKNIEHNYSIMYEGRLVGGCGIKIDKTHAKTCEIGYFLDEAHWNKGIVTKTVKILENIAFKKLGLKRIEIRMDPRNKASERVAVKNGYEREGKMKMPKTKGKHHYNYLYAKVR